MLHVATSGGAPFSFFVVTLVCLAGCSSDKTTADTGSSPNHQLPVIEETTEEILVNMRQLDPYSELFEEERFKLTVKLDPIRKSEGIEGFDAAPVENAGGQHAEVDPQTGQIAWRALSCFNPDCVTRGRGGGPYLFVYPMDNMKIGPNGKVVVDENVLIDFSKPAICPLCGQFEYVRVYEPPEAVVGRRNLMEELRRIRLARKRGKQAGNSLRGAGDIMKSLDDLPKLFLVPQPDKVRDFNGVTAPVSS